MAPFKSGMVLCAALVLACAQARGEGTRRALLIGIESYADFGEVWYDLDGPFNDVALVRDVLQQRFGFTSEHVTTLLDATRGQIEEALEDLIDQTGQGDLAYVHYSGHGSRVPDANGDEAGGGFDSTLVPVDARDNPRGEILDDEIALWMHRLRQRTADVVFVVDACHSGTISRAADPLKTRGAPTVDDRSYAWSRELDLTPLRPDELPPDRFVRLSACLDSQRAKEYRADDDRIFGLFTWTWCQALMEAGSADTYGTVMRRVTARVFQRRAHLQRPQIEGRQDALLFAGSVREMPRLLAVRALENDVVRLEGGLLQGVAVGSLFEGDGDPPPRLEITGVDAITSLARVVTGDVPGAGDLFRETARGQRLPPFRILLDEVSRDLLASALADAGSFEMVETPPADALVRVEEGRIDVLDERGDPYGGGRLDPRVLSSPLSAGVDPVLRTLRRCYALRDVQQMTLAHLGFRPDVSIELLELLEVGCDGNAGVLEVDGRCWLPGSSFPLRTDNPAVTMPAGTVLTFQIRNDSLETLYFYLFNLTPDGRVRQFFPGPGEDSRAELWSGDTLRPATFAFELEEGLAGMRDSYVWFVTREPTDLGFLEQDAYVPTRGARNRVERLAQGFGGRRTRGEAPVPLQTGDLATRMICIEVTAPSSP